MRFVALCVAATIAILPAAAAQQPTLVEQRMLTQEGLAIALASTVLQSQLAILIASETGGTGCVVLTGKRGSIKLVSAKTKGKKLNSVVTVYFDNTCQSPYVEAHAAITPGTDSFAITETADYLGPTGFALGTMAIDETAYTTTYKDSEVIEVVTGLGRFTPADKAPKVDLGLECDLLKAQQNKPVPCEGGIAQNFPSLKKALASVTPLNLKINRKTTAVAFSGTQSDMATGALGALSITAPTETSLGIGGTSKAYGSAATQGSTPKFALFPPTPTSWTITDTVNDTKFSIAVTSNKTRASSGTVARISTGKTLAQFSVDQSGTGSITYSNGATATITSWLLSD